MIVTKYIRRHFIERAVRDFRTTGRVLEIGSGRRWRYIDGSLTVNRDISAGADLISDAENLTLANDSFGAVLCLEVMSTQLHPRLFSAKSGVFCSPEAACC